MFIERLGKVFRRDTHKEVEPEIQAIQYYQAYFRTHNKFPLFSQVLIETRTDCNRKCSFCPQSFHERPFQEMGWDVFDTIIQQLYRLEFSGRITFGVTNEPLLDHRTIDMVRHARQTSPRFFLDITTNGNLLTLEMMDQLFTAGLDNININDYRSDRIEHKQELSKNLQPISAAYIYNPKIGFHYRSTNEVLSSRGGNVEKQTKNTHIHSFCNYPFRKLVLSPNGDVVLCCMDYLYEVTFGNVRDQELEYIWHSSELNNYRTMLLTKARKKICAKCDEYQY